MPVVVVAYLMLLFNTTLRTLFDCMTRYNDCPREHIRLFVSTGGITNSSNITPVDDHE